MLDGFAGPGVYENGEEGSPLIALRTLLDHTARDRLASTIYSFIFFEPRNDRFASLEKQLARLKTEYAPWPENVRFHARPESFEEGGEWILSNLGQNRLAPIFAFIDPFGVSGLPLDLIRRLSQFDKAEVFINFMLNTTQRFATAGNIDHHLVQLFGTDEFTEANDHPDRRTFLRGLYERQLRQICGFKYVLNFEMVNLSGQSYDLFYGTKSLVGLKKMKEAMWKIDRSGSFSFSDRRVDMISLFESPEIIRQLVRGELLARFTGTDRVKVETIEEFILVETAFSASHWNGPMQQLERDGLVEVISSPRKGKRGMPAGTIVRFLTGPK